MPFSQDLPRVNARSFAQVAAYLPGSTFGPRRLSDYELVWVLQGEAVWSTDQSDSTSPASGGSYVLRPGRLVLARRGTTDSYQWTKVEHSRHAFVHFNLDGEIVDSEKEWPTTRSLVGEPVLSELCSYLLQLASVGSDAARRRSDQILGVIVDLFVRGTLVSDPDMQFDPRLASLFQRVRTDWEIAGMRIIGNELLATWCALSLSHLSRLFREQLGRGPASVLETARLVRAAITLQRTDLALRQVAEAAGFASEYHFSRRFASLYTVPPGRYRRLHRDSDPLEPVTQPALRGAVNLLLAGRVASDPPMNGRAG